MKRILALATVALASGTAPAAAQLLQHDTGSTTPTPPAVVQEAAPAPDVDVTGIWYHIRRDDRPSARRETARLQEANPGWTPPPDLVEALRDPPPPEPAVAENAAPGEPAAEPAPAATAAAAEPPPPPPPPGDAERLRGWQLLAAGRAAPALAAFDAALAAGAGADARHGRLRALLALGRLDEAARQAEAIGRLPEIAAELAGRHSDRALAAAASHPAEALAEAERAGRHGQAPWLALGWRLLEGDHPEAAATSFARAATATGADAAEAAYGRVLALGRAGRGDEAAALACDGGEAGDDRLAGACRDLLTAQAGAAAEAGDWPTVARLTVRLRDLGLATAGSETLRAWSLLETGAAAEARELFAADHAAAPTAETAEALLVAARAAGDGPEAIAARATGPDDPLLALLREADADRARDQALYRLADRLAPGRHPALAGLNAPYGAVGGGLRVKDGDPGAGRIEAHILSVEGGAPWQGGMLALGLDTTRLDNDGRGLLRGSDTLHEPRLLWSRQDLPLSLSAEVGTTPLGGAVAPLPVGRLDLRHAGDDVITGASLFAASRRDSLLALSGQEDPETGRRFGRVVESGASGEVTLLPAPGWAVTAGLLGSVLTGRDVADNTRVSASLATTVDLPVDGLEYLRAGPFVRWQHYADNLGHYTWGHGGYFSPQRNLTAGVSVDALTTEGDDWLLGLRGSLGWTTSREDATPFYPDGAPAPGLGGTYDAADNKGLAADVALSGGVRLAPQWMLVGQVSHAVAPDYEETAAGLSLRYTFGTPRGGVVRDDLPRPRSTTP